MIFFKSDSKKNSRNCNFFVYKAILAYNSLIFDYDLEGHCRSLEVIRGKKAQS